MRSKLFLRWCGASREEKLIFLGRARHPNLKHSIHRQHPGSFTQGLANLPVPAEVVVRPGQNTEFLEEPWRLVPGWGLPIDEQEEQPCVDELWPAPDRIESFGPRRNTAKEKAKFSESP